MEPYHGIFKLRNYRSLHRPSFLVETDTFKLYNGHDMPALNDACIADGGRVRMYLNRSPRMYVRKENTYLNPQID